MSFVRANRFLARDCAAIDWGRGCRFSKATTKCGRGPTGIVVFGNAGGSQNVSFLNFQKCRLIPTVQDGLEDCRLWGLYVPV